MKIAVCDDRADDRGALKALLEAYGRDFEIREYGSGKSLCRDMDYIRECGIVFLDINMDGLDGLEAARRIKAECPKVHIVLVTAYVNYALDGYKVKASRFLLKDDLEQTLQECMDDILREIRQEERVVEFGFVEGNVRLKVDDIIYIETSRHKNVFYTQGQTFSIYKKMDELEEDLKGMGFVRIHQSFLINMKYIERISSYVMILTTGKEISVPKSRYPEVKRQYTLFKGGGVIMGLWILSFCLIAIEAWGAVYFFDIFMERKRKGWLDKCRYVVLYFICVPVAVLGGHFDVMGIKVLLIVLAYMAFCAVFYRADWKQCIFFSVLNYSLLFLIDIFSLLIENILNSRDKLYAFEHGLLYIPMKLSWILLLFVLRRIWKGKNSYGALSHKEWRKFGIVPLFTLASMLLMYFCYSSEKKVQAVYLFLSAGLIVINFFVMVLMQDILVKGELLRESVLTDQKKESQLAHYRDMQAVYERQGRKMHDYKNQIRTMQVLLKEGDTQAAAGLAERLTESISVEMSAVNTNHPVVNAVLNQKFHAAREQGVSMIFRVGDMGGMRLDGEEAVILLSNLLDNAIHECVKVVKAGRKAVINIKLVQEGGKLIFSVKNPVAEKVQVTDGIVLDSNGGMHGVGLMNVKAVVDKYGGDFAASCDGEKFQAVVMI